MKKKLAMIRQQDANECPFGLPIALACKNAGDTVLKMQPLEDVPSEQRKRYKGANRRAYRHHQDGKRCIYADKIIEGKDIVNCDFGDFGEGIRDHPIRPSPYYPRVFNGIAQTGLYVYPVGSYSDNSEAQQLFSGINSMYASTGEIRLKKLSDFEPDKVLSELYYEIEGIFEKQDD